MKRRWDKRCTRKEETGKDVSTAAGKGRKERNDEEKMAKDTCIQSVKKGETGREKRAQYGGQIKKGVENACKN